MHRYIIAAIVLLLTACGPDTPTTPRSQLKTVVHFPQTLDPKCGEGGARLYDECGSQMSHYRAALDEANKTGKVVLVSYGAEWCIWCHVLDAHLSGETGAFRYPREDGEVTLYERAGEGVLPDARALNAFAAKNFVVLHLESDHAPDTADVLEATGASNQTIEGLPFVFTLKSDGKLAAVFDDKAQPEVRREGFDWYRGYDRKSLLAELERMRDAARTAP